MRRIFFSVFIFSNLLFSSFNQVEAQKNGVHNIILMVGDGMGLVQIQAGYTVNKGSLNLLKSTNIGISKTTSADHYITDSAAGATAFATGHKTNNRYISISPMGDTLKTFLEIAHQHGYATGLVVTCRLTDATPAAFVAHCSSRDNEDTIATNFLKTDVDVFIGGGKKYFSDRSDHQDLIAQLKAKNYQVVFTMDEAMKIKHGKLAALVAEKDLPKMSNGRGDMLLNATETALSILQQNKKGFFLMVEGSQIDWGNHANNKDFTTAETVDFDNVVGKVLEFAEKDGHTLVIVLADHASGGMSLVDGDISQGKVEARYSTKNHDGIMIPVFAFGSKAELFRGFYENTAVFDKMMQAIGFKK